MDAILALGHFCESHGPCVILCTQRNETEPNQSPHGLTVPWCEACQSLSVDQALVSRDGKICYITTRTPLQQDLAFLLKQAVFRSLSCEEQTAKDGGTIYFGDNERGHVITHTFSLQDSLARGFHRKYSILILMRDKVHLLNSWCSLVHHMKELASELQVQAAAINGKEQIQRPQRAVRQAQVSSPNTARSLSQLTGQPAVFGHIHLWFCWMLAYEQMIEKPNLVGSVPMQRPFRLLRQLLQQIGEDVFRTACFCILTGVPVEADEISVVDTLRQLLPAPWPPVNNSVSCKITKIGTWRVEWSGSLPARLPTLQVAVEKALKEENLANAAIEALIESLILQWLHTARVLACNQTRDQSFLQALGVHNHDIPLITYWTSQISSEVNNVKRNKNCPG